MPKRAYVFTKPCEDCGAPQTMTFRLSDKIALAVDKSLTKGGVRCKPCAEAKLEADKQSQQAYLKAKVDRPQADPPTPQASPRTASPQGDPQP